MIRNVLRTLATSMFRGDSSSRKATAWLSVVFLASAFGLVAQPARCTTYYVSASGKDTNAGTITSPWLTIQHAANSVKAGDTVYVRAGVYKEVVSIPS
jgi:pectin methylesterase-like acyl-CoA thioesterase